MNFATIYNPNEKTWRGNAGLPMFNIDCSIGRIAFNMLRSKKPNTVCQISDSEGTTLTYGTIVLHAIRIAQHLTSFGITDENTVAIISTNTTHVFPLMLACWFNCTAFHLISGELNDSIIRGLLELSDPSIIFCDGQYINKIELATVGMFAGLIVTLINHMHDMPSVHALLDPTETENTFQPAALRLGRNQVMAILNSVGTETCVPKCAFVTNAQLLNELGLATGASTIFSFGMINCWYGFLGVIMNALVGGTRIITTRPYTPDYMLTILNSYNVTLLIATPAELNLVANGPGFEPSDLETVKDIYMVGDYCTHAAYEVIKNSLTHTNLIFGYGLAEFGSITSNFNSRKPKSVGKLLPDFELKIINENNGEPCEHNTKGKILVRALHNPARIYDDLNRVTRNLDPQGWYYTGDFGFMDNDNDLIWMHREADIYKINEIFYVPHDIEDVIAELEDIIEVCVFLIEERSISAAINQMGNRHTETEVMSYVNTRVHERSVILNGAAFFIPEIKKNANGRVKRIATKDACLFPLRNGS